MTKTNSKIFFQNIAIASVIAIFFIVDRILKRLALSAGSEVSREIIPGLFSFRFSENYFISFSIPLSGPILNAAIALIIVVLAFYIIYLFRKKKDAVLEALLFCALFFGAISNLIDRLTVGFVVDYFFLKNFTVFNLADFMISFSSLLLILKTFSRKPALD